MTFARRSRSAPAGLAIAPCIARGMAGIRPGGCARLGGSWSRARDLAALRPPLALGLGLLGHRPLHRLRDADVADLDGGDLDPPRLGLLVDDLLQVLVELLALGE